MASDGKGTRPGGRLPADELASMAKIAAGANAGRQVGAAVVSILLGHVAAVEAERDEARGVAVEAVEELRDVLPYKCEHLAKKHGDNETLARLRAVVTGWGGANRGE
jgi:hypothetical protein